MRCMTTNDALFSPTPMPDAPIGTARAEQLMALSGLEIIGAIMLGKLPIPPMARTMQQWIETAAEGVVEFRGDPSETYFNPMGLIHGGWSMTLLDSAMGCAVQTILEAGETYVTLGIETKFLRPITARTGQVRAIGKVIDRTRRTATAEARIEDSLGRILATGTTTCFLDRPGHS